jgi:hypothetical protein
MRVFVMITMNYDGYELIDDGDNDCHEMMMVILMNMYTIIT